MQRLTLGSDPEFGVVDFDGVPKSVVGLLGGTKDEPLGLGKGCARQEDNVGAEITIPPSSNPEELLRSIKYARGAVDEILSEFGLKTKACSSLVYAPEELDSEQAQTFGCHPSFDVYSGGISERPEPEEVGCTRSFGFHVHLGWHGDKSIPTIEGLVKLLDIYIGVPSILLDTDTRRRDIYGNPGDFRFCEYGIEYRTLGGALLDSDENILFVFNQAIKAFNHYKKKGFQEDTYREDAMYIIKNNRTEQAIDFLIKHKIVDEKLIGIWNTQRRRQSAQVL
jgi:hypothetical protein